MHCVASEADHRVRWLAAVGRHHRLHVRGVVGDRRRRDRALRVHDLETGARVRRRLEAGGVTPRLRVGGEQRERRSLLRGLGAHVLVQLIGDGARHPLGIGGDQAAVEPEAVQRGRRLRAAVGVVERPAEVGHVPLVQVLAGVGVGQVGNDREHAHLLDQSPGLGQRLRRILVVVGELLVVDLGALDLVVVVEALEPRGGADRAVGVEVGGVAHARERDRAVAVAADRGCAACDARRDQPGEHRDDRDHSDTSDPTLLPCPHVVPPGRRDGLLAEPVPVISFNRGHYLHPSPACRARCSNVLRERELSPTSSSDSVQSRAADSRIARPRRVFDRSPGNRRGRCHPDRRARPRSPRTRWSPRPVRCSSAWACRHSGLTWRAPAARPCRRGSCTDRARLRSFPGAPRTRARRGRRGGARAPR